MKFLIINIIIIFLIKKPIEDGGQWDMLVNIITKYGLMPKKNFPESFSCETSNTVNVILNSKVIFHNKQCIDVFFFF